MKNVPPLRMQVPLIGGNNAPQAQAAQVMGQQVFMGIFMPLVIELTKFRVVNGYPLEDSENEPSSPERVAEEAWSYANAAMKRLGFEQARPGPE